MIPAGIRHPYGARMSENKDDGSDGAPKKPPVKAGWATYAVLIAVVAVVGICVARQGGSSEPSSEDRLRDAKRACQEKFIPPRLKAPATAKFSEVTATQNGTSYAVAGQVDSQNAFGALVRAQFSCVMHPSGDQWVLDSASVEG
jgi:hypothetical protein